MSIYVNPTNGRTKEEWLWGANPTVVSIDSFAQHFDAFVITNNVPLCLVENAGFTALGVASTKRIAEDMASPDDPRPRKFVLVHYSKFDDTSGISPDNLRLIRERFGPPRKLWATP